MLLAIVKKKITTRAMNRLKDYITIETASAIFLFIGTILALLISNTELDDEYEVLIRLPISISVGDFTLAKPLIKWVNDGLMALFFLLLTLETKFHLLAGDLIDKSRIKLGVIAACGGVIIPALIYITFTYSNPIFAKGWAIPIATDTAFVLGIVSFFRHKVSLNARIFIVFLSIIDDVIAIVVLALFYTPSLNVYPLFIASLLVGLLWFLNLINTRHLTPYILAGIGLWLCIIEAGIHGTIAGVLVGMFIPLQVGHEEDGMHFPLKKLEQFLHPLVAYIILPSFAFLNAEISFKDVSIADVYSPVTLGIIAGLLFGKSLGIILSSFIYLKINKERLPYGLNWLTFSAIGVLCGIGFTFSLFIGILSFDDISLINQMKLGVIFASLLSAVTGIFLLIRAPIVFK